MTAPSPGPKIRVLLVDDSTLVRIGLSRLLREGPDIDLVGEAGKGPEAVAMARTLRPDVVLMDVHLQGMTGIEATRRICEELPEARIIGLSMYDDSEIRAAILEAGASEYLCKAGPESLILSAIRAHGTPRRGR